MKVFCLGGAGKICREAILDLVEHSEFEKITVADFNEEEGRKVVEWLNDPRVDFVKVNVFDHEDTVSKIRGYDIVMDGTAITLNGKSTACIAEACCHGINLNGFGEEDSQHELFQSNEKTCLPGFGMTPGLTQMMAMHAANQLDTIESVRVSHGSFRPIAFSRSIAETTSYEYDPNLPSRVVFEDGEFIQVPPFARPMEIELPQPYGKGVQYIIPHSETRTLAQALKHKDVQLIEVRGTWPQQNMQLVRALYDYGILRNDKFIMNGTETGIMDCISEYLYQSKEGSETELYGYALHIQVIGTKDGERVEHILIHTHPSSDGTVQGWEGLRAYTRNVAIPFAIAAELIAKGEVKKKGIVIPEDAFADPVKIFNQLEKRGIFIHEEINKLDENNR
ncbi:saccharopine dehydrogenase family protein [Metabacillus idriensis]|uniref:saccharopine dehydrogenase family protein n=1 Tax=Metabacillus idriensis TaxID=324768 RepID=UPI003D2A12D1